MLTLANIRFAYGARTVLDDVSVTIDRGAVLGVLGPNGAGKSTLARVMLGLLAPEKGSVMIDGHALGALSIRERSQHIAAVLQSEQASFAFSVRELVMFAREAKRAAFARESDEDRARVEAALRAADALAFADRPLDALSGGERQRALLARALAQETSHLVLDEPTAFMDLRHQQAFAQLVQSLTGVAVVWILHDPDLALRYCTDVLVLSAGKIAAAGKPREVLTPELLAQVFSVRAERALDAKGESHLLVTGVVE